MARHPDDKNPSDDFGIFGSGQFRTGVVVDVKDPEKRGRVKVRMLEQTQQAVPDDKLPWIFCGMNNLPSMRGMGFSPPNYQCGSKVLLASLGQQGYTVMMSLPNAESDDTKADTHEDTRNPEHRAVFQNADKFNERAEAKTTADALALMNSKPENWKKEKQDHKENVDQAPAPAAYRGRPAVKDNIGSFPTVGINLFQNYKNPQQFIKNIIGDKGSVIPGALDMLENLKKVKNPLQVPLPTGVAGIGNLLSAVKGLLDLIKKQKQNDNDTQKLAEETALEELVFEEKTESVFGRLRKMEQGDTVSSDGAVV